MRALAGPLVVVYYLLIMLSILRLSPAVSLFAGAASATGYAAVWVLGIAPLAAEHSNAGLASAIFATESVLMVVAGALAAGVAARVRGHVAAALREAEARREVERYQGELNLARQIQQGLLPPRRRRSRATRSPGGTGRPTRPAATSSTSSTPAAAAGWWSSPTPPATASPRR